MKKTVLLTVIFLSLIVNSLVGCTKEDKIQDSSTPESTLQTKKPPHIRGIITSINSRDEKSISLLVEGGVENDTKYEKAYILVDEDTEILKVENNDENKLKMSDLKIGQTIEVFFVGAIATSDPVQATAGKINIIEGSIK